MEMKHTLPLMYPSSGINLSKLGVSLESLSVQNSLVSKTGQNSGIAKSSIVKLKGTLIISALLFTALSVCFIYCSSVLAAPLTFLF